MIFPEDDIPVLPLGRKAFLRPLVEDDVTPAYVNGLNDPKVHHFLVGPRNQRQTFATVQAFVRSNMDDPRAILFGLFVDDSLRGTSRLHDIAPDLAFLGIALFDKSIWGQGWGTKVICAITKYATTELGVKRVLAGIEEENITSQRAFTKAGFRRIPASKRETGGTIGHTWEYTTRGKL